MTLLTKYINFAVSQNSMTLLIVALLLLLGIASSKRRQGEEKIYFNSFAWVYLIKSEVAFDNLLKIISLKIKQMQNEGENS